MSFKSWTLPNRWWNQRAERMPYDLVFSLYTWRNWSQRLNDLSKITQYYRLTCVSPIPQFMYWNPDDVTVLGDNAFTEIMQIKLDRKDGCPCKKRETAGMSTPTERSLCRITGSRPSASRGERPQEKPSLPTSCFWTSSLHNYEKINSCCLSHSVCGILLWQPKQTKIHKDMGWPKAKTQALTFFEHHSFPFSLREEISKGFARWWWKMSGCTIEIPISHASVWRGMIEWTSHGRAG